MYGLAISAGEVHNYPLKGLLTDEALTSNKIDATTVNSPTTANDRYGNANKSYEQGRFSGTHKHLSWSDDNSFSFGNGTTDTSFSIVCWLYVAAYDSANYWVINKDDASTLREWQLLVTFGSLPATGGILLQKRDHSAGVSVYSHNSNSGDCLSTSTWYNIGFIFVSGTGANAADNDQIYKNGVALSMTHVNNAAFVSTENTTTPVRTTRNAGTNNSNGRVAALRFFQRELTAYEMALLYAEVA
jgi:hypothetical protein